MVEVDVYGFPLLIPRPAINIFKWDLFLLTPAAIGGTIFAMRVKALLATLLLLVLGACNRISSPLDAPPPPEVAITIIADGETQTLSTSVATVSEALAEAQINVSILDLVEPDEYLPLEEGMTITVVRVIEQFESHQVEIAYSQQVVRNEGLPQGDRRLLQAGRNGIEEIVYRIEYRDGVEVDRRMVRRTVVEPAADEIVMVGVQGTVSPVVVQGTLAYISGGNAVVMRTSSNNRDTILSGANLDGRVFALSPDGQHLLYSQSTPYTQPLTSTLPAFNSLWTINTTRFSGPIQPSLLGVENVLWANWSPDGARIAYSTANPIAQPPGWEANNDLWIGDWFFDGSFYSEQLLEPSSGGVYGWWGAEYRWSSNGHYLAYGQADQVGYIDVETGERFSLENFSVYHTYSDWVWTPRPTWSPEGNFVAAVVHGPPVGLEAVEDSRVFDLWVWEIGERNILTTTAEAGTWDAGGLLAARLAPRVGMWGMPAWSPSREVGDEDASQIAFLRAVSPLESATTHYSLWVMDRDGSEARQLFPPQGELGLRPQPLAWSPAADQVAVVYRGDLYLINVIDGAARPLTGDGINSNPVWVSSRGTSAPVPRPVDDKTELPFD